MTEPGPPQRIGDAERDRAAEYLREHMSVGRLTQEEFDERLTAALQARTAADLEPLFVDLPAPRPGQETVPGGTAWPVYSASGSVPASRPAPTPPAPPSSTNAWNIAAAVAWPIVIGACFVIGWSNVWWLVFIPIVISSIAGQRKEEQKRQEKLWLRSQERQQLPPGEGESPSR